MIFRTALHKTTHLKYSDGPVETVLADGEWLSVSTDGFSEQQRGRPLVHLIKELVQNALDSIGAIGVVNLTMTPMGDGTVLVHCDDDGPGAEDLSKLNVVFFTGKKDGVHQRGRMGRGFKELLSIASGATVRSRDQRLSFQTAADANGATRRRAVIERGMPAVPGFQVAMTVRHDEAESDLASYFQTFLVPEGVTMLVNGVAVPPCRVHKVVEARVTTERFANGRWEKPVLATRLHLVPASEGAPPLIYEMGIPVCPIEWDEPYHVDVQQRVPMNPNRDAVMSGYPSRLHKACLAALLPEMTRERALAAWVGEAAVHADPQVQQDVITRAFGENIVRAVPTTGKFDVNADAEECGATVLHTAHMPGGFRKLLTQQVPSAAQVVRDRESARAKAAREEGLSEDQVQGLDLDSPPVTALHAAAAIRDIGRAAVLERMRFAGWFCTAVMRQRHDKDTPIPVKVAYMPGVEAAWSIDGELTIGLNCETFWRGPVAAFHYTLLIHEMAHHDAFHHGRSFPNEVETYAGFAAMVAMEKGGEARGLFPALFAPD